MQATLIIGSMCALVAHAGTAAAAPAWCKGGPNKPHYNAKQMFSETDPDRALDAIVAASCYPDDEIAPLTKQIEKLRATWSKRLGLTEADWEDAAEFAHLPRHLRGDTRIAVTNRQAAWSAYSPLDQYGALNDADIGSVDAAYLADAFGAKLTQLGRLGYVADCLESSSTDPAVAWAMCATDAAALDAGKIAAEIRADTTHSAADRMTARMAAYELLAIKLPKYQADVKALTEKDPAYAKMFSLGRDAHAQWAKVDARWVALADALDDARVTGSRKASAGCTAKTWEAWKTVIAATPAKRLATIHAQPGNNFAQQLVGMLIAEPDGYLAALTLNECAKLEGKEDYLSNAIGYALVKWPGFRGPRTGTQTAILTAGLQLDDRGATIEYPELKRDWISGDGNVGNFALGAIASIKLDGERATVTFVKQKVTQKRCTKGHYTNRISQIMTDGTVVYYYQCDAEVTETIEVAPSPPVYVGARYVAGLKPGMSVSVTENVAVVAYPKGKTVPSIVTGVEVK